MATTRRLHTRTVRQDAVQSVVENRLYYISLHFLEKKNQLIFNALHLTGIISFKWIVHFVFLNVASNQPIIDLTGLARRVVC